MLKLIIGTFSTLFVLCTAFVIFYWRDTGYDPTAFDLVTYFLLLPVALCAIILSPYLIYKGIQHQKEKNLKLKNVQKNKLSNNNLRPLNKQNRSLSMYSNFV
jgi:hypothetical protein